MKSLPFSCLLVLQSHRYRDQFLCRDRGKPSMPRCSTIPGAWPALESPAAALGLCSPPLPHPPPPPSPLRLCTLRWHTLGSAAEGHLWQRSGNWELGQFCFKTLCQGLPGLSGVVGGGSGRKHDCALGSDFSTCRENQFVFIGVLPEDLKPLFFLTLHCG